MLANYTINIRTKLAFLWATIMSLYIYADFFSLMTPNKIQRMMDLETPLGPTTPTMLIGFSILLIIPALMLPISILLRPILSKWLNIIIGFLYAVISVLIIISDISSEWMAFFVLYQIIELFIFFIIVKLAWKWPREKLVT